MKQQKKTNKKETNKLWDWIDLNSFMIFEIIMFLVVAVIMFFMVSYLWNANSFDSVVPTIGCNCSCVDGVGVQEPNSPLAESILFWIVYGVCMMFYIFLKLGPPICTC